MDSAEEPEERQTETREQGRGKSPGDGNSNDAYEVFDLFRSYLDVQLKDLKKDLHCKVQKVKEEKKLKFSSDSHRIQFEFNLDIQESLEGIQSMLEDRSQREAVKNLIEKLQKRNKLIKIADISPGGWDTVREYVSPTVCGSDSEDEKKLKQAEARALKKRKLNNSKLSCTSKDADKIIPSMSSVSFMPRNPAYTFPGSARFHGPGLSPFNTPSGSAGRPYNNYTQTSSYRGPRTATEHDICFGCGNRGHFRRDCPRSATASGLPQFKKEPDTRARNRYYDK